MATKTGVVTGAAGMVDESRWPVVTIRFPPDPDDAALRVAIERMGAIFARNEAVVVIIDVRLNLTGLTSARRALVRDLMASIQKDADRLMIGAIYVAPSPLAAGVITALNWSRGKRPSRPRRPQHRAGRDHPADPAGRTSASRLMFMPVNRWRG